VIVAHAKPTQSARRMVQRKRVPTSGVSPGTTHTALVLQGGAGLGAYEAGVLKSLLAPPARTLDIVTGCSIGAVMAAILVGARTDPAAALDDLWRRFVMPANPFLPPQFARAAPFVGGGDLYQFNPLYFTAPLLVTHMYEPGPLAAALDEWVDFRKLNRAATEVIVTAVEIKSGQLVEFSNRQRLTANHILASASLPPVFPMTRVGDGDYWDGGLIANNPLRPALNAIEAHNHRNLGARWELIAIDLFVPQKTPPRDMGDVVQRAFELVFFGKFQQDMKLFAMYDGLLDLCEQINGALPAGSSVRKHPALKHLQRHRRIDRFTIIRASKPEQLGGPADFSSESIERRIELGQADAQRVLRARAPRRRGCG